MRSVKILGSIAVAALALAVFVASASATTLETSGTKQTGAVSVEATLKFGSSSLLSATGGSFANTCTSSSAKVTSSTFTGTTVSGPISSMSAGGCTEGGLVGDAAGSLSVENISGTTNGTVRSIGAKVTTQSPFGTLTCTTASSPGTDIGTLTGTSSGTATMDINGVLNCGFFLPSAKWEGTYSITSPFGLGVTS